MAWSRIITISYLSLPWVWEQSQELRKLEERSLISLEELLWGKKYVGLTLCTYWYWQFAYMYIVYAFQSCVLCRTTQFHKHESIFKMHTAWHTLFNIRHEDWNSTVWPKVQIWYQNHRPSAIHTIPVMKLCRLLQLQLHCNKAIFFVTYQDSASSPALLPAQGFQ